MCHLVSFSWGEEHISSFLHRLTVKEFSWFKTYPCYLYWETTILKCLDFKKKSLITLSMGHKNSLGSFTWFLAFVATQDSCKQELKGTIFNQMYISAAEKIYFQCWCTSVTKPTSCFAHTIQNGHCHTFCPLHMMPSHVPAAMLAATPNRQIELAGSVTSCISPQRTEVFYSEDIFCSTLF